MASGKILPSILSDEVAFKTAIDGAITLADIDPNNITRTSLYNLVNQANLPDTGWWFLYTHVHSLGNGYITQIAIKMTDSWYEVCTRNKNNGVWNTWKSFATQGTYQTQIKTVTLTANANDWSSQSVTWDTPFVSTPHISLSVVGSSYVPEPISLVFGTDVGAGVGMYRIGHDLSVQITATGWTK